MKVEDYQIKEIESKSGTGTEYAIEISITFKQKKDRENFIKMMREEIL